MVKKEPQKKEMRELTTNEKDVLDRIPFTIANQMDAGVSDCDMLAISNRLGKGMPEFYKGEEESEEIQELLDYREGKRIYKEMCKKNPIIKPRDELHFFKGNEGNED